MLQTTYKKEIAPKLKQELGYDNAMAVPRITKVVINTGLGKMMSNVSKAQEKALPEVLDNLTAITSQRPAVTRARKSIAGFKIREGNIMGAKVTLRGKRMYDFLDRLIHIVLPRLRDFRGIPIKNIDDQGNLTIGIKEYTVFPEVPSETVRTIVGLQITVVTDTKTREEAITLFRELGFPLQK